MSVRDLIPWGRQGEKAHDRAPAPRREDEADPFLTLHREVNRLFDDVMRDMPGLRGAGWPTVAVVEDERAVRVTAELPGMDEHDVEVVYDDGVLAIRGEKRSDVEDKDRRYSEHFYGRFERLIPIPVEVEEDRIDASFRKGVLTVTLPRSQRQRENTRRIQINH